jgi:hypothetical protein
MTYMSSMPRAADRFVRRYLGLSQRAVNFDNAAASCATVTWSNLCQSPETASVRNEHLMGQQHYALYFGMHFVDTPRHAQGPMSSKTWKAHVHEQVKEMRAFNSMMQQHSAFLTRNLTTLVRHLQRDSVPYFLTYRQDESGRRLYSCWFEVPIGIVLAVVSFVLEPVLATVAMLLQRPCDPPFSEVPHFPVDLAPDELGTKEWVDKWQQINPLLQHQLKSNQSIPNQADFLSYYETFPSTDPTGDAKMLRDMIEVGKGGTEHDTKDAETRYVYTKAGVCGTVKMAQSATEYRFELIEDGIIGYGLRDFIQYRGQVLEVTIGQGDFSSYLDDHPGIFFGAEMMGMKLLRDYLNTEGHKHLNLGRNEFETLLVVLPGCAAGFQFIWENEALRAGMVFDQPPPCNDAHEQAVYAQTVQDAEIAQASGNSSLAGIILQSRQYRTYGKYVPACKASGNMQPRYVDEGGVREQFDYELSGTCMKAIEDTDRLLIQAWWIRGLFEGLHIDGTINFEWVIDHSRKHLLEPNPLGASSKLYRTCISSIVDFLSTVQNEYGSEAYYLPGNLPNITVLDRCAEYLDWYLNTLKDKYECATPSAEDQALCGNISLSFPFSIREKLHEPGLRSAKQSDSFDVCSEGTAASQDWSVYNCSTHLGPCCGDGKCERERGESALHCAADCSAQVQPAAPPSARAHQVPEGAFGRQQGQFSDLVDEGGG